MNTTIIKLISIPEQESNHTIPQYLISAIDNKSDIPEEDLTVHHFITTITKDDSLLKAFQLNGMEDIDCLHISNNLVTICLEWYAEDAELILEILDNFQSHDLEIGLGYYTLAEHYNAHKPQNYCTYAI